MEIILFFGLFALALGLAYFYFAKKVIYLGVLSGVIIVFLGVYLAATGNIESVYCFSDVTNETAEGGVTSFIYNKNCHTEVLDVSRDMINAMGIIMMFLGAGMIVDFISFMRREPDGQ